MERLTDLPNIGPKLAGNLERIGVTTQEQFQARGAEEAFLRIQAQVEPAACLHQLEALAGAEEGVKRSLMSSERKSVLKAWYQRL